MKRKTIVKILDKKIGDWISSIEDIELRDFVKRDLIVTGGSIASMLLNEKVNDFDIYFKTKYTTFKIAEYYIKQANKFYVNNISDSILEVIDGDNHKSKKYNTTDGETMWDIFEKTLTPDRVKIYIPHVGYWNRFAEETLDAKEEIELINDVLNIEAEEETMGKYEVIYLSENAITLSDNIQLIIRFYGEPEVIHRNYDFVHATSYFHYKSGLPDLVLNPNALESLLTKELKYIGSKYPLTSVIRTRKFINRGWSINAGTYLKILWQVSELDLTDTSVLYEQLVGVDVAYFSLLIKALTEVEDKDKITYNYIAEIIDRIFD